MSETSGERAALSTEAPGSTTLKKVVVRRRGAQKRLSPEPDTSTCVPCSSTEPPATLTKEMLTRTVAASIENGVKSIAAIQRQLATEITPQSQCQMILDLMQENGFNPYKEYIRELQSMSGLPKLTGIAKFLEIAGLKADQLENRQQSQDLTKQLSHGGKLQVNILQFGNSNPAILRNIQRAVSGSESMDILPAIDGAGTKSPRMDGSSTLSEPSTDMATRLENKVIKTGEADYSEFLRGAQPTPIEKKPTKETQTPTSGAGDQ